MPLDDTGREQAAELAERVAALGPLRTLICSPLHRARETAAIVGARIGMTPIEDARFAETDVGDWTDRTFAEVGAEDPARFAAFLRADAGFAFPGGESFARPAGARAGRARRPSRVGRGRCRRSSSATAASSASRWPARGDESAREWKLPNTALVTLHADGRVDGR